MPKPKTGYLGNSLASFAPCARGHSRAPETHSSLRVNRRFTITLYTRHEAPESRNARFRRAAIRGTLLIERRAHHTNRHGLGAARPIIHRRGAHRSTRALG